MPQLAKRDLEMICDSTESHWHSFRNQQLFITGGTGFFGRWMLESLLAANHRFSLNTRATVLTREPARFRNACPHLADHPAITLLQGDMQSCAFPQGEFAFVIHAAADVSAARGHGYAADSNLVAATVDGTRRTLDFAASHCTRRLLMVSSGAVYGSQPPSLSHIPETYTGAPDACLPQSAYGEGKWASEALCAAYSVPGGLECAIARPFAFVGPHLALDQGFAIGDFIRCALASQPIAIRGDPSTVRSYLYAADLAVWLWTILSRAAPLRPYNVGSDQAISLGALAEEVASVLCPGMPVQIALSSRPGAAGNRYVPAIKRSTEELGLRQTIFLRDAIRRTAEWHGWRNGSSLQREGRSIETH
jgi:nucleoside-diphosphate-sugar epimerase